jgi:hypothetical protein
MSRTHDPEVRTGLHRRLGKPLLATELLACPVTPFLGTR